MPVAIHWFRSDLRLYDNPALSAAAQFGKLICLYILEDTQDKPPLQKIDAPIHQTHALGCATRVWLHHSLSALNTDLDNHLVVRRGPALAVLREVIKQTGAERLTMTRRYAPHHAALDEQIKHNLEETGICVSIESGNLLWEPEQITKHDGTGYKVFTPFYRRGCLAAEPPRRPLPRPKISFADLSSVSESNASLKIEALSLKPNLPWADAVCSRWDISEAGAQAKLDQFVHPDPHNGLGIYAGGRDFPTKPATSHMSPYLAFGQISPHQAWYAAEAAFHSADINLDMFRSELGWREFSYHLLHSNPDLKNTPLQTKFTHFKWLENPEHLRAWQTGQTGYPLVDAGMRELYQTGYMHNRVRMIVGSFLVKNLLLHWHQGEAWFWDCLFDADAASNTANWQWIAGCGADAAPYFRVFNPVTQGQKFDADGHYTRQFVPELANMPSKYLFNPFDAPEDVLRHADVRLGKTYPYPLVDIRASRLRALEHFAALPKA